MQAFMGGVVVLLTLAIALDGGPSRRRLLGRGLPMSEGARRGLMGFLVAVSAILAAPAVIPPLRGLFFAFCGSCPLPVVGTAAAVSAPDILRTFFLGIWYYTATVLPVFVLACLMSGALTARGTIRMKGILGAFGLAAVLPVCSCGVIPLGKAMIDSGGRSVRAGLMFIAAAPLLSPIILILGWSVLGPGYVAVRVVASFIMGAAVALVVPYFLDARAAQGGASSDPGKQDDAAGPLPGACDDCVAVPRGSALAAGWSTLTGLFRYVLYGIVLGAGVAAALPAGLVANVLGAGALSTAAAVVIGVPVNLCAGEEILLTAPLAGMGFTMGHAVAFALAGTGICVSSLPLLRAVLGRRAVLVMVALYLVVPFALGTLIASIPAAPSLEVREVPAPSHLIEPELPQATNRS